ncbi:MAG: GNAT family N-acetyltransferase [Dehalococcoidia bacterium]|nr:MAG: GNAT family N-acetyltransferase [Dehalococcoidia bacterium]
MTQYSTVPIRFEVKSKLSLDSPNGGLGGIVFHEEDVIPPYMKDYDEAKDGAPIPWLERFDTSNWVLFLAREKSIPVGGAAVAFDTPEVRVLRDREGISVLWDIRVHPAHRRSGMGSALFSEAAKWSKERNCKYLQVETQNVNVPACRFYVRQGCMLGDIIRFAYHAPEVAHEVMLVWYLDLVSL